MANTRQRALILTVIKESHEHLTAEQIYSLAKEKMPGIVLATVYNNLNALYHAGEIGRVHAEGDVYIYDRSPIRHAHLICTACGRAEDVMLSDFTDYLRRQLDFSFESYDLNIHALCHSCKNRFHSEDSDNDKTNN